MNSLSASPKRSPEAAAYGKEVANPLLQAYHIGVIDYLQKWDTQKKMEASLKRLKYGRKGEGISAVNPARYKARFLEFARSSVLKL